jgi:hypothetical protein
VNYLLLALALLPAVMALISLLTLIRVTLGGANFTSTGAMWSHILTIVAGAPIAAWLFSLAFA